MVIHILGTINYTHLEYITAVQLYVHSIVSIVSMSSLCTHTYNQYVCM